MEILLWPNPKLKQVCEPVIGLDELKKAEAFAQQMIVAASKSGGIGLAANQVGDSARIIVANSGGEWHTFINPRIVKFTGDWKVMVEGCLSIPGYFEQVKRNTSVLFEYTDPSDATVVDTAEGRLAHILQHEIEHLDGKMFIDKVPGGRDRARAALKARR